MIAVDAADAGPIAPTMSGITCSSDGDTSCRVVVVLLYGMVDDDRACRDDIGRDGAKADDEATRMAKMQGENFIFRDNETLRVRKKSAKKVAYRR